MLLSLVSGTYNRLQYLSRMVASFRANIPRGMDYEIVLVDGGSTDGTLEWIKQQPDIKLIEHGALLGAIKAFCDGAKAASGDYVLLANDDISFDSHSIIPAIVHLETHPGCAAVAFADNRPAPGYSTNMHVQTMRARDGQNVVDVIYAQVGLFRRDVGKRAGWWGADDTKFNGHTYGGDNYLSARIWEMGYTIEAVDGCQVSDHIPQDNLRKHNEKAEQKNPAAYYKRYSVPPLIGTPARVTGHERLRILYLPIYEPGHPTQQKYKRGLRDALKAYGLVYEIDYLNKTFDLPAAVKAFQPHLLLMQVQGTNSLPLTQLAKARQLAPEMVVVNWNGDVYEHGLTTPEMLAFLKHVDLQLVVNGSVISEYARNGIRAAYWQVSFEPVDEYPPMPAHDVVFLGNAYTPVRRELGRVLQSMSGINVGLYGRGWQWGNGDTVYNFPAGASLYQNAKIAVGDNQYPDQHGFVSNRIFEALAHGVLLLHQPVAQLEELTGLQDGVHYVSWTDLDDLQRKIRYWLMPKHEAKRQQIAANARAYVRQYHSFEARVAQLFNELIPMVENDST